MPMSNFFDCIEVCFELHIRSLVCHAPPFRYPVGFQIDAITLRSPSYSLYWTNTDLRVLVAPLIK